jgi:uncharacterized membrane protein YhaH (DUF805 family)
MGFTDAVRSGLQKSFDWKGRASRPAFWWFVLATIIAGFALGIIIGILAAIKLAFLGYILYVVFYIGIIFPSLSLAVRRMHDQDKSGWWLWIGLIPFVGGIILLVFYCLPGTEGPNQYGSAPDAE